MRVFFTFLVLITFISLLKSQSGVILHSITCGCNTGCCNPTTSGTGCPITTTPLNLTIPANSDATLTVGVNQCTTACSGSTGGSGWETADFVSVPVFGINLTGVSGGADCTLTTNSCISTGANPVTFTISFTSNRLDEQCAYNLTIVPNGGVPGCTLLPIKLSHFEVKEMKLNTYLSFSTASETNNDFFNIERSSDGRSFESIGEIKGAGNSSKEISYEFIDERPLPGINYYRIKQTDFDGQFSYSEIRSVRHKGISNVSVTPRTTEGRLDITTELEDYTIAIYNAAGQEVKRMIDMSLDQSISVETMQAGVYFVKIFSRTESEMVRIVKI